MSGYSTGININMPPASSAFEQEVVYMECRHNHAASLGRVAYDGCHEFLRDNNDAMICAACECHRSFHRKHTIYNPIPSPPPPQTQQQTDQNVVVMNNNATITHPVLLPVPVVAGSSMMMPRRKKRTLFTPEQRNRMIRFAESLGWRPQKGDKKEIQDFCIEMGMSRRMFLVWLSNNRRRVIHHQNQNNNNNSNNNNK